MRFIYEVFSALKHAAGRRRTLRDLFFAIVTATLTLPVCAADLSRTVAIGDSLAAGFQNFSLFHSPIGGQTYGYPALVAKQAGIDQDFILPLISFPGIPPTLLLTPSGIVRSTDAPGMRENPGVQPWNLAVPGFTLADTFAPSVPW